MLSKEQAVEKEKKILKCVRTFLKSNGSIQEVSKITGIPFPGKIRLEYKF